MAWGKSFKQAYWIEEYGRLHGYPDASEVVTGAHVPRTKKKVTPRVDVIQEVQEQLRLAARGERSLRKSQEWRELLRKKQDKLLRAHEEVQRFWERRAGTVREREGLDGPPTLKDVFYVRALEAGEDAYGQPLVARVFLRTRTGFKYERVVGLNDFVT